MALTKNECPLFAAFMPMTLKLSNTFHDFNDAVKYRDNNKNMSQEEMDKLVQLQDLTGN